METKTPKKDGGKVPEDSLPEVIFDPQNIGDATIEIFFEKLGELTDMQQIYVLNYLKCFNATEAARHAGYSPKHLYSRAFQLSIHPQISEVVKLGMEIRRKRLMNLIDEVYVIEGLKEIIERAMSEVPVLDRNGEETGMYNCDYSAAIRAYELLGKYLDMFTDTIKVEEGVKIGQERRKLMNRINAITPKKPPGKPAKPRKKSVTGKRNKVSTRKSASSR